MKIIRPLLQEIHKDNPWQMLVCCILLNLTHRRQVDKVREELFDRWPTPEHMMEANETELAELLKPLGFYNKRAKTLIKMSKQWVTDDPTWIHVGMQWIRGKYFRWRMYLKIQIWYKIKF